jgi:hypothetical protein
MADYDDWQVANAPPWLGGESGALWSRCLGIVKDAVAAAMRAAVNQRFADVAHISSLVALLEDRGLDPAWRETETSVRARIKQAWATWQLAGTKAGMAKALELAGYTNYEIIEQTEDGTLQWWQFYIVIKAPFPWTDTYLADGRWDDPGVWDDGGSWAEDIPAPDLARLRLIARKWKPTHAECTHIRIVHSGETWDATAPPGTWDDDLNATWGDDVSYLPVN